MPRPPTTEATFWSRVAVGTAGECWLWTGGKRDGRYGQFTHDGTKDRAHRWAWRFAHGPIGDAHVLHHCDMTLCCNPAHLYLGTHQDNMRDREARGRNKPRTRASGSTKLTPEQADEIRARWVPGRDGTRRVLAEEFGISRVMVWKLGTGRA